MVTDEPARPPAARRARHLPPHAARRERPRATATSSRSRRTRTSTASSTKPRIDFELLEQHAKGLIATTGCLGGAVCQALLPDDYDGARELVDRFQSIFGRDSFFIELQDHGLAEQHRVNPQLLRIARELRAPLLATNDSHYTHRARRRGARRAALRADGRDARRPEAASSSTPTSST